MTADLPLDVRARASEAARKVDRDYGHWQDWVGSIDEFQHERALSTVDAVVAVVAPEIARPLLERLGVLDAVSVDLFANRDALLTETSRLTVELNERKRRFQDLSWKHAQLVLEVKDLRPRIEELEAALRELIYVAGSVPAPMGAMETLSRAVHEATTVLLAKGEKP